MDEKNLFAHIHREDDIVPVMDRLFTESASGRRRFLDRLVVALEPGHAREMAAFESAAAQRNRLLDERPDPAWLSGLEDSMARHAVAATASRAALLAQSTPGGFLRRPPDSCERTRAPRRMRKPPSIARNHP